MIVETDKREKRIRIEAAAGELLALALICQKAARDGCVHQSMDVGELLVIRSDY